MQARHRTVSTAYLIWKRLFDISLCSGALLALSPLLAAIALAVRLSSPGSIFYREVRVGLGGRSFTILKFRSMYTREYLAQVGFDECEQTELRRRQHDKGLGDPRITPIGRFLRQSSLDELPQILNVLLGDMSLVGPRPVVAAELRAYGDQAYFYQLAHPGITGLWQVSGRSNLSFNERTQLDARYCAEWTLWQDVVILARTVPAVLKRNGAY